jgi:S-adenosylmethionine:tRNA ribosyltransferase-isomerase
VTVRTSDFNYDLPEELIAQRPLSDRAASRLMLLDRATGARSHHVFADLPALLAPTDALVLNDTRVVPARFWLRRPTGGKIEGLFLREISPGRWEVMLKRADRCKSGERLAFVGGESTHAVIESPLGEGVWRFAVEPAVGPVELLGRIGRTPLPPYIHRDKTQPDLDQEQYQTVYAAHAGAVAAPTAGLHFTPDILAAIRARGIEELFVTLHVGLGTFQPVKADEVAQHQMHEEWYEIAAESAAGVNAARAAGRRIVAVGTTSVRVLETAADESGRVSPGGGWTKIFLYPPARFKAVGALVTNFHLPCSTLLMLVAAFCAPGSTDGIAMLRDAYAEAIALKYRFYSYGDAMLII